jgi:PAS domain S-box-containing protein
LSAAVPAWWLDPAVWGIGVAGLVLVCALLFVVLLQSRRRYAMDSRQIVRAMEDLRAGELPDVGASDPGSSLALVFDAMQRLGQDVGARVRAVEETEVRARRMMEILADVAVVTTDIDGDVRSFSPGAALMFGWDEQEMIGQNVALLFAEDEYKRLLPKLARREVREQGIETQVRLQRRDQHTFPADLRLRQMTDKRKNAAGFVIRVRDASERVELERRHASAERRYEAILGGLSSGVAVVRAGRIVLANRPIAELLGVEPEALSQQPLRDHIATRDLLAVEEALSSIEAHGGSTTIDCGLTAADGSPLAEVRVDAAGIEQDDGRAVLAVFHDRTEQSRVEEELRRNERRLDSVIEAASDGILLLVEGPCGARVQMVNAAFGKLFGTPGEAFLGAAEVELHDMLVKSGPAGEDVSGFVHSAGHDWRTETFSRTGTPRVDLEVTLVPLTGRDRQPQGRVVVCRDLTAQREGERKLQLHTEQLQLSKAMLEQAYQRLEKANVELQARGEQLSSVNEELRKLDEMKTNLLGNVSHELQTPLVSIRGYTEMILRERLGPVTDEQGKGLSLCLKNTDRLISMIDNLLVLARSEPETTRLELSHFDLRGLVTEAAELLRERIVERKIRFSSQIEGNDLRVHADRDKMLQVLINLLSNAIKFNEDNGKVRVTARMSKAGFAEVHVEDSGVGIPEDARDRVFDRHFQVEHADRGAEGSGIGLSIVKQILDSHGCRVWVESAVGEGSRFRFTIPLSPQQPQTLPTPKEQPADQPGAPAQAAPAPLVDSASEQGLELASEPEAADGGETRQPDADTPRFRIIRPEPPE